MTDMIRECERCGKRMSLDGRGETVMWCTGDHCMECDIRV